MDFIQTIKTKAKLYKDYTAICLSEMAQIPSLSCEEEKVILKIKEQLEEAGVKEVLVDGLGNLIAKVGKGPKILAIDAHIDTVDTGDELQWDTPPFSGLIKDGYVHGRGTVDQKGGAASMVAAARILTEMKYDGDYSIYFTFTVMEEDCDGLCWLYLIEKENIKPGLAVITEPTNLGLYRGHRGRMEMEVHTTGLSCHGSAPERGKNVIYYGAKTALAIQELHGNLKDDEFLGKGSIAPTVFQTDSPSLCAVPDVGFMHIDRRLTWGETKKSAVGEIQNIIGNDSKVLVPNYDRPSYKGTVYTREKYYPTWKLEKDHPFVQTGRETYKQLFDEEPRIDKWTFSTNGVALCGQHKIPCIGFGPGNEVLAHAPNEKVPVDHLEKCTAFYALLPYVLEEMKILSRG